MNCSTGPALVSVTLMFTPGISDGTFAVTVTETVQPSAPRAPLFPVLTHAVVGSLPQLLCSRLGASWLIHATAFALASPDQSSAGLPASARATRAPSWAAAIATCRAKKWTANWTVAKIRKNSTGVRKTNSIAETPRSRFSRTASRRRRTPPCFIGSAALVRAVGALDAVRDVRRLVLQRLRDEVSDRGDDRHHDHRDHHPLDGGRTTLQLAGTDTRDPGAQAHPRVLQRCVAAEQLAHRSSLHSVVPRYHGQRNWKMRTVAG